MTRKASSLERRLQNLLGARLEAAGIHSEDPMIVAFSGGADSTALLTLLARRGCTRVRAVHIRHNIRPDAELDQEETIVRRIAAMLQMPLDIVALGRGEVEQRAHQLHCGVEAAARTLRYAVLRTQALQHGSSFVLTGHHADDDAETRLLALVRGGSPGALRGIRFSRWLDAEHRISVVRPLLDISRAELVEYLGQAGLPWSEDSSNQERIYTRNRIRISLMPLLDREFPNWRRTLGSLGDRVAEEHDCLLRQARQLADQQISMRDNGLCLNRDAFLQVQPALRNLMLQEAMLHLGAPAGRLWRLAKVLDKAIVAGEETISLSGVSMHRDGQAIMLSATRRNIRRERMTRLDFLQEDRYFLILKQEGEYHAPGFACTLAAAEPEEHSLTTLQGFLPLVVRNREAGDFVITATGRKMVDDYLKESGIPQVVRNMIPVVEDRYGICAVLPAALECCSSIRPLLRDPVYGGKLFLLRIDMKGAEISHGKP